MKKKYAVSVFGLVLLILLINLIYKLFAGRAIDMFEIMAIGVISMFLLFAITWGNRQDKDGIFQDEELGKRIIEQSSKISYIILYFLILAAVLADKIVNQTSNAFLVFVLIAAMIVFPITQYLISRKYQ